MSKSVRAVSATFPRLPVCLAACLAANLLCASIVVGDPNISADAPAAWGNWSGWGDQGDGTYRNPVIPADYSDIDCIRAGDDYYAIASTMQFSPGMVILHSRDLVNWTIAGHAISDLTQIGPALNWDRMDRYGRGVWAGSIRHHDGKYHVFFGAPDEGYFVTTATNPAGLWTPLHPLLREAGWDDCSAIWDDDGQAWFVSTRFAEEGRRVYKTYLFKMSLDARSLDFDSAILVNEGSGREANKLIKVGGWYYLIYSEHTGAQGRYVLAKRARRMSGPWSEPRQLTHGDRDANQPNQGGIVQGPDGRWYFFTHHGTGAWEGRCASLSPVTWIDEWPVIGAPDKDGIGHFVWGGKMPSRNAAPGDALPLTFDFIQQTSDDFDAPALASQWEWNYQPRAEKWSLAERPGWLRLRAFKPLRAGDLMRAGNTLTQRALRVTSSEVTIKLDLAGMADGQHAGLCHFARAHSVVGVVQEGGTRRLEYRADGRVVAGPEIATRDFWLRSTWGIDGKSRYAYSTDGREFIGFGEPWQLTWGHYRGDRIGIYNYNDKTESGHVDIDFLRYETTR